MFRWLQPEDAAKMSGNTDRAGQIGTDIEWDHARCYRCCRAAALPSRRARSIPGVIGATKERIISLGWIAQHLGNVGFAEQDATCLLEACAHRAVFLGHVIEHGRSGSGADARRSMGVFQREGPA